MSYGNEPKRPLKTEEECLRLKVTYTRYIFYSSTDMDLNFKKSVSNK